MTRARYIPKVLADGAAEPFESAEQAWLWYGACQLARVEGVKPIAGCGDVLRPCDPDDIYCAVVRLFRARRISSSHLAVLGGFAVRQHAPDPDRGDGQGQFVLWQEALEYLGVELRHKGIVV